VCAGPALGPQCSLQAEKPKVDIRITTVKEALKLHEHPEDFVGKTVEVSNDIAWFNSGDLERDKVSDGYVFAYYCSTDLKSKERFGNKLGIFEDHLNYWCDTDAGLKIKEKLPPEKVGTSDVYMRVNYTFTIKTKEFTKFSVKKTYHIAELVWIEPKK